MSSEQETLDNIEADMREMDEGTSACEHRQELEREQRNAAITAVARRLAQLRETDPVQFERQRREDARRLGIRASILDRAVTENRRTDAKPLAGSPLEFPEPEPWSEAVDGARLLDDLTAATRRYLVLPEGAPEALSLWTIFSFCLDLFRFNPRLAFVSPTKQCGKSTALDMLSELVYRPLPSSSVTAAVVFRVIEAKRPTLIIDEADTFLPDNENLRGVLNSGHARPTAFILRTVGDEYEARSFSTWAPIVTACIGKLPDTLTDRSIVIAMRRKTAAETVQSLDDDARAELFDFKRKIARWVSDYRDTLERARPAMPNGFRNRLADNWRPLLAIADAAGGHWPALARDAAVKLSGSRDREDDDVKVMLLSDVRMIFEETDSHQLFSQSLCERLATMEGRPWAERRNGKPITPNGLARMLKAFGVFPAGSIRIGNDTGKGYRRVDFQDAFDRYLPPSQSVTTSQRLGEMGSGDSETVTTENTVTDANAGIYHAENDCDAVTASATMLPLTNSFRAAEHPAVEVF